MSLFEELKRRNVFRVAVAYLVTSWLLLQLADLVLENIHAPDWVIQSIMLVLALGFPLAVIFAWAFELTPEGLKKEKDVDRTQSITHRTGRKLDFTIIAILAVAVVLLLADRFTGKEAGQQAADERTLAASEAAETAVPVGPRAKSVAVLPFVNMSSDPEQEYFSDGISEEILNALARVKDLKVAGRTSSFAFKGQNQDLRKIGETLGVEHILEGSVRKAGDTVRITAQLIQVDDGFHLWSDTYDRELTDVFAIQDEIASSILQQLKAHLLDGESNALAAERVNPEAYDLYLLAKQRIYERSRPALESATELLDRAIALDAGYAAAYAQRGVATLLLSDRDYGTIPEAESQAQGKLYIDQALRLDPQQPEALAALGLYYLDTPGQTAAAIKVLEQAHAINPNLVNASNWLQTAYLAAGRLQEGIETLESLRERDPLYRPGIGNLNQMYVFQNRLDDAKAQIDQIRPFMPHDPFLLRLEANVFYAEGQIAKGLAAAERALAIQPDNFPNREIVARGLAGTGQIERLINEGPEDQRLFALMQVGRSEEALISARKLADSGRDIGTLLGLLANYGRPGEAVAFVDERWPDLEAFHADHPAGNGRGISTMLDLAFALSEVGDQARFEQAMQYSRTGLERLSELGFTNSYLDMINAVYQTMAGDHQAAIDLLAKAVDGGYVSGSTRLSEGWAALDALKAEPEYQAVQAKMLDHLNAERAELGLEALET